MKRLAIVTTHPIQYNAPWFRLLAERRIVALKVFYTWGQLKKGAKFDPGFGANIEWDIPLLDGYDHCFVNNIAINPGSHHFKGIANPTLIKEIEDWNANTILVFGWSFTSHLKVLRYFKGRKKVLFRGDSNLLDEVPGFSLKKTARKIFLKWVYRHVDEVLYVGAANKQYYLNFGIGSTQLIFAPHAIDNDRFSNAVVRNDREVLGIPPQASVFIFVGKFEAKKDPILLLDSFIKLENKNAHLLMVGSGELEKELKQIVARLSSEVSKRIHFLPFQNQLKMPDIYRLGDILVLPSQGPGETWGLAVNEAMACSRAILVSDKCGCAVDLVKERDNGFIFKGQDGDDLLQKMKLFLSDQPKIKAMGNHSLDIIRNWNFEQICIAVEGSVK